MQGGECGEVAGPERWAEPVPAGLIGPTRDFGSHPKGNSLPLKACKVDSNTIRCAFWIVYSG